MCTQYTSSEVSAELPDPTPAPARALPRPQESQRRASATVTPTLVSTCAGLIQPELRFGVNRERRIGEILRHQNQHAAQQRAPTACTAPWRPPAWCESRCPRSRRTPGTRPTGRCRKNCSRDDVIAHDPRHAGPVHLRDQRRQQRDRQAQHGAQADAFAPS